MSYIKFASDPYREENVLNLLISAAGLGFSGFVEIFATVDELEAFAERLTGFPENIDHTVKLECGDKTGEWPYYLLLEARTIDGVGHSAIRVSMHSFVANVANGQAEFFVESEPASINELGSTLKKWAREPFEPLVWQPKL